MSYNNGCGCHDETTSNTDLLATQIKLVYAQPVHIPKPSKRRAPFLTAWCAHEASKGYPSGSIVIHDGRYWYNLCVAYAPPGVDTSWVSFNMETLLKLIDPVLRGEQVSLAVPVYAEPSKCTTVKIPGVPTKAVKQCNLKFHSKDTLVAGSDGKLYYALHDNTATYPPSADWGGGKTLQEIFVGLLKGG